MGFEVCGRKTMAKDSQHGRSSSLSLSVWIKKIKENVWYKVIHRGHWKGTNGGVRKALLWDGQALAQDWIPWGLSKRQGRGGGGEIKGGPNLEWNLDFFFFFQKMRPLGPLSLQTGSQSLPEIWFSCLSNGIKPNMEAHAYYPSTKEVEPGGSGVLDSHSHKVWWFLAVTSATSSPGQLAHLWEMLLVV